MKLLTCPKCNSKMKKVVLGETNCWTCEQCPAVLFDLFELNNVEDLKRELEMLK